MYLWNDTLIECPESRCNWMLSQVQWNFFFLWWFWSLRFFIYLYLITEWSRAWKLEKEDLYEKGQLTWWTLSRRIGCIPSNILQRVKQWKSIQKGWVCFLYSLKTSTRLINAEPYFCAVYSDIIFKKYINNNRRQNKRYFNCLMSSVSISYEDTTKLYIQFFRPK